MNLQDNEEEDDAAWEDCDNEEEMVIPTRCLFSSQEFKSPSEYYR